MDDEPVDRRAFVEDNRARWEELARIHPETDFYDVEGFLDGKSSLNDLEREELGPLVDERTSLLHLQCHFGLDTLSWARTGAEVVGVDFAETGIETARRLATEAGLADRAEFVQSDLYDLPHVLDGKFDVVFTSYGVLCWLPDIEGWAEVVEQFVAPGGTFYVAEHHPFTNALHESSTPGEMRFAYPYFGGERTFSEDGSYADPDAELGDGRTHERFHSMGDIVTAIASTDLEIEFLHEHPYTGFRALDAMEEDEDGRFWLPGLEHDLPFLFSLRATMPEA